MGYYSSVGLILSPIAHMKLIQIVDVSNRDEETAGLISSANMQEKDGSLFLFWDSIKWYDWFSSVQFVNKFLNKLKYEDFLFLRIGEEVTDMEERGGYWENPFSMGIFREISFEVV